MGLQNLHSQSDGPSSLVPLLFVAGMLVAYLIGVYRVQHSSRSWNGWRTVSFLFGIVTLVVALSSPLTDFAHRDFRGHMIQHLLIGMFAPLALVLSAPLLLVFRTLPHRISRLIATTLRSAPFRWLSHPASALFLNIGGMYVLYLTPLYAMTLTNLYLHALVHLHFLVAGCLFTWSIAGAGPGLYRGMNPRLIALFLGIAAHAYLSKLMYIYLWPQHTPHSAGEIRAAAQIMYYGGDLAEGLLAVALFAAWYRKRSRHQTGPQARTATGTQRPSINPEQPQRS